MDKEPVDITMHPSINEGIGAAVEKDDDDRALMENDHSIRGVVNVAEQIDD